jgi:acyl-coenzyme A synthetase/AMP-(fatty) acid ligase
MINVGGYRVEPTEIETALNSLDEVENNVVSALDISHR